MLCGSLSVPLYKLKGLDKPPATESSVGVDVITKRKKIQTANVLAFVLAMVVNGTSNSFSRNTQAEIAEEWDVRIMPAGWAFSIWGVIYLFLVTFVAYQALPANSVKERSNVLILDRIGMTFVLNMLANALWLVCFGFNTPLAFFIALLDIIALLATGVKIMMLASRAELTKFERFIIGGGFTLYNGWVSAATILNVSFFLKSCGLGKDQEWETAVTCSVLVVGWFVYLFVAFTEMNPLFGLVYIWPLLAIRGRQKDYGDVATTCLVIIIADAIAMISLMQYCRSEAKKSRLDVSIESN